MGGQLLHHDYANSPTFGDLLRWMNENASRLRLIPVVHHEKSQLDKRKHEGASSLVKPDSKYNDFLVLCVVIFATSK